jgi:hypothetical protein
MWPSPKEVLLHGDIEAAAVDILTNDPDVTALVPALNISSDRVGFEKDMTWVQVSREGGPQRFPMDHPRLDINCYAARRSIAYKLTQQVRGSLFASAGYRGNGLTITAIQEEVGPVRSTDGENETPRYYSSMRFTTRAVPDSEESS